MNYQCAPRDPQKPSTLKFPRGWIVTVLWLGSSACRLWVLWQYDNTPGKAALPPKEWPVLSHLDRATERPTLIMVAHPKCSCTRASFGELADTLARARIRPKTYVLFLRPLSFAEGWENTDLWRMAASLPGVTVVRDDDGSEARRFGAATSGQTVLYGHARAARFQRRNHRCSRPPR